MAELTGRGALITGGGRGIGEAVARALADAGVRVLVAARSREQVDAVAASLDDAGAVAFAATVDVADPASVGALAERARETVGEVDILVNNAGVSGSAPVHRTTLEDWNRMLAVNATGTFLCTRAFLPGMLERGRGRIVNVASVAGLHGARYIAAYAASKHAVIGLTRSAAADVAGKGVTINAVCPGYVDTPMTDDNLARIRGRTGMSEDEAVRAVLAHAGQHRLITAAEVAEAVLFLCREEAGGINGQAVVIDGGAHLA